MCDLVLRELNEIMSRIGEKPEYDFISDEFGTHQNEFKCRVSCPILRNGDFKTAEGCGLSKKAAKQKAAHAFMEKYLSNSNSDKSVAVPSQFFHSTNTSCIVNLSDPILHNVLQMLCDEFKLAKPEYTDVSASGPSHAPTFTFRCQVDEFIAEDSGGRKYKAKLKSCKKMIALLMDANGFYEIFETVQLTESANSSEVYCFCNTLKGPQLPKPIGIFGRRKLSPILSKLPLTSVKLPTELPIPNGSSSTSKIASKASNNHQIFEKSRGNCFDSNVNTNLIDFEDDRPQKIVPMKTKCRSLNNLSDCVDNNAPIPRLDEFKKQSTYIEGQKAIKKINNTLQSVEEQLRCEICNTLPNPDITFKDTVEFSSCSYTISISSSSSLMKFSTKSGSGCTDPSIRIGCLVKLLQKLMKHVEKNIEEL
ncbi:uncharacterized protein LOC124416656 [Diprion similis]|uniref:uncharacterized protein LOC124416656 n=1 Tax=Diprion similis TaxID=362088 RepID=UPI001EF8A4FC|nr:uncharacterized protein LOC124416656 [Diprion similis]XP_046753873.1 uncharacterized protein LOC124416656 [Diprion similis]